MLLIGSKVLEVRSKPIVDPQRKRWFLLSVAWLKTQRIPKSVNLRHVGMSFYTMYMYIVLLDTIYIYGIYIYMLMYTLRM